MQSPLDGSAMKTLRGDGLSSFPTTPATAAHERTTTWSTNLTPASYKSLTATPLFHTAARSTHSGSSFGSHAPTGVLSQDAGHSLEIFAPFPSLVVDSLRRLSSFDSTHVSGHLDASSGFAWIVLSDVNFLSSRKLLLWNFQQGGSAATARIARQGASNEVYQFSMPGNASDHSPSAQLVAIVSGTSNGVVAVSPYGHVRYWTRMNEPGRFTDATVSMVGDEVCLSLLAVPGTEYYAISTTSGRLILVSLQMGAHNIFIREVRASTSVMRTVGSWLGFGSKTNRDTQEADQTVALRITPHSLGSILWHLKASGLQAWRLSPQQHETLIFDEPIIPQFENELYNAQRADLGGRIILDFTICDFQVLAPSTPSLPTLLSVLIASSPAEYQESSLNPDILQQRGDHTEFHIATFEMHIQNTSNISISAKLVATALLPDEMSDTNEYPGLTLARFDSPPCEALAYVHWEQFSICAPLPDSGDIARDIVDVTKNQMHRIFGASDLGSAALYFTPSHGIVKFQLLQVDSQLSMDQSTVSQPQRETKKRGYMAKASAEDILAEAFMRYMSQTSSQHLSSPAINYPWSSLVDTLWKLDFESATKNFSLQILDSRPSEDPRWPEYAGQRSTSSNIGSNVGSTPSSSTGGDGYSGQLHALLYRQIEEKQEVHTNFIRFLVEVNLWEALSEEAKDFLEQASERLASAAQLRSKHNELLQQAHSSASGSNKASVGNASILQRAIELALTSRGITRSHWERAGLGAQDIFYAQVSKIDSVLEHSLAVLKSQLGAKISIQQQFQLISQNNDIFQSIIAAAVAYRTQHAKEYYEGFKQDVETRLDEDDDSQWPDEFIRATIAASGAIGPAWTQPSHYLLRESIRIARQFVDQVTQNQGHSSSKRLGHGFASTSSVLDIDLDSMHDQLFHMTDALLSDWYQEVMRIDSPHDSTDATSNMDTTASKSSQKPRNTSRSTFGRKKEDDDLKSQYASLRSELIAPFKSNPSQYERALHLAEKYREFIVIVEICEAMDDSERLWKYARHFSSIPSPMLLGPSPTSSAPTFTKEFNFERVVFEYYFVNKLFFKLLTPPHAFWPSLRDYLDETPDARKVAWIHMVRCQDWTSAEQTLDGLAYSEQQSALNQTTLLSLAKLAQLAQGSQPNQVDEVREQRLYLRNAQLAIRAMFDHTDDDAAPEHASSLVARLLGLANGTESIQPGYSLQLALDLWRNTVLLRTPEENLKLLETIWHKILSVEHWSELAAALQQGEIDDQTLEENIQGSLFFNVARNTHSIRDELPLELFSNVAVSIYSTSNKATMRVLASAFEQAYAAKGVPLDDNLRSQLIDDLIGQGVEAMNAEGEDEENDVSASEMQE